MASFCSLPDCLRSVFSASWLTVVDVARMDSAFCSHSQRLDLLRIFCSPNIRLQYPSLWKPNDATNKWIVTKGASVDGIYITDSLLTCEDQRNRLLQTLGCKVRCVEFVPKLLPNFKAIREVAAVLAIHCKNLIRVDGADTLSTESWLLIADSCPQLEEVVNADITSTTMAEIARKCTRLKKVVFAISTIMSDALLLTLCQYAPNIEQIVHCSYFESPFLHAATATLATSRGYLMTKEVTQRVTDAALYALADRCPKLHTLCLRERHLDAEALLYLTSVRDFRRLELWGIQSITPTCMDQLLANCPNLRSFCFGRQSHAGFRYGRIGKTCPFLQELMIVGGSYTPLSAYLSGLTTHTLSLRKLVVIGYEYLRHEHILAVLRGCPQLGWLDLSGNWIDDAFLYSLGQHCPALQVVLLWAAQGEVSDAGILAVAMACAGLRELSVKFSQGDVSEAARDAVRALRPKLQWVP